MIAPMRAITIVACLVPLVLGACADDVEQAEKTPSKPVTVDVSDDLQALLETDKIRGACKSYFAKLAAGDSSTDAERLLCGKEMFFYEPFGTAAVPRSIIEFMGAELPKSVGVGYTKLGMIDDPNDDKGLPIGLAAGVTIAAPEKATKVGFTCAACHFGQLADGRYAVGLANHNYDYGKFILALSLFATEALGVPGTTVAPAARAEIQPMADEFEANPALKDKLFKALQPLIAEAAKNPPPQLTVEQQGHYAKWLPGTQDFLIAPIGPDDKVHTVTKIISLWSIPTADDAKKAKMPHSMLAWTGGAKTLLQFARGFVAIAYGSQDEWSDAQLKPLADYIHTLRAPATKQTLDTALVAKGKDVFKSAGCTDCHDGHAGSGRKIYTFKEIGTDDALKYWDDADLDGKSDSGVGSADASDTSGDAYTHGVKSPRLAGVWAQKRLLHNGSVASLEALLCHGTKRPTNNEPVYSDKGHAFGCDLESDDKKALIAYLRTY